MVHKQEKKKANNELKAILTLTYLGIPLELYLLLRGGVDDVSFLPGQTLIIVWGYLQTRFFFDRLGRFRRRGRRIAQQMGEA